MAFCMKTFKACTVEEMQEHLNFCKKYRGKVIYGPLPPKTQLKYYVYIEDNTVEFRLTYKDLKGRNCTYITRKDEQPVSINSGLEAFRILNMYCKVPHAKFPGKTPLISGFLYKNEKYDKTRHSNCYGYDINSSYTYAMTQPMPDTTKEPRKIGIVKADEIGFDENYELVFEGGFAMLIYPKIESPFIKFANTWYNKKKNAKNPEEKKNAKFALNAAVGYLQRINPVLRAAILGYANKRIRDLVDENTLYSNTDSIISLVPRPELKLGTGLGEWKIEHQGDFAYNGFTYQWNQDVPTYRGVAKSWFKPGWDLLKDESPKFGNKYYFNKETFKLEEVENEKV